MNDLEGKRLLFLGGTAVASIPMVRYAQSQGVYVIVTDNLPLEKSPAKLIADEAADVSTRDLEALVKFAVEKKVDGVFCGVSEGNLPFVRMVCERLHFPCYFTEKQWDMCQEKKKFKQLCRENQVPTPMEYEISDQAGYEGGSIEGIRFPVIVKPVDGFAAVGITICNQEDELHAAIECARNASKSGKVLVEEYVTGDEYTSLYTIKDGVISLSLLRDRYPSMDHPGVTSQFDASIGPSRFYSEYMKTVDPAIKRMLKSIGAYAGSVFFQGIAGKNGLVVFECGYRINALCDFFNLDQANHINYMKMMIEYALTGRMDCGDLKNDNPDPNEFCCIFNMTAHAGTIAVMEGLEDCKKLPNVIYAEFLLNKGAVVIDNNSMAQSVFRAYINASTIEELRSTIIEIQRKIRVESDQGENMLFLPFDVSRIHDTLSQKGVPSCK